MPAWSTIPAMIVMSFDIRPKEGVEILRREIGQAYPDHDVLIIPDVDVSD